MVRTYDDRLRRDEPINHPACGYQAQGRGQRGRQYAAQRVGYRTDRNPSPSSMGTAAAHPAINPFTVHRLIIAMTTSRLTNFAVRFISGCCQLLSGCCQVRVSSRVLESNRVQIWLRTRDSNPEPCG